MHACTHTPITVLHTNTHSHTHQSLCDTPTLTHTHQCMHAHHTVPSALCCPCVPLCAPVCPCAALCALAYAHTPTHQHNAHSDPMTRAPVPLCQRVPCAPVTLCQRVPLCPVPARASACPVTLCQRVTRMPITHADLPNTQLISRTRTEPPEYPYPHRVGRGGG